MLLIYLQGGPFTNALHNAVAATPIDEMLPELRQPALLFDGKDDVLHDLTMQAAGLLPNGAFKSIPGKTWGLNLADPTRLVGFFIDFLAEDAPAPSKRSAGKLLG